MQKWPKEEGLFKFCFTPINFWDDFIIVSRSKCVKSSGVNMVVRGRKWVVNNYNKQLFREVHKKSEKNAIFGGGKKSAKKRKFCIFADFRKITLFHTSQKRWQKWQEFHFLEFFSKIKLFISAPKTTISGVFRGGTPPTQTPPWGGRGPPPGRGGGGPHPSPRGGPPRGAPLGGHPPSGGEGVTSAFPN